MTRAVVLQERQELQATGDVLAAFADFVRIRVADGDASPETLRTYHGQVRQYAAWCTERGISPACASEDDITDYRRELIERGYARSTIALKLAAVRRFYEAATWRGLRADNPAAGIKAPKERTDRAERIRYLSLPKLAAILDLAQNARDRAIVHTLAGHGLRVSECAGLQVHDLDFERGTIRVHGKGNKWRTVDMVEHTRQALQDWLAERNAAEGVGALFVTFDHRTRGHAMTARAIRRIVDNCLYAVGAKSPGTSCHALRHSFATWSRDSGASELAIADALGHANLATTRIYTKIANRQRENPARYLEQALYKGTPAE